MNSIRSSEANLYDAKEKAFHHTFAPRWMTSLNSAQCKSSSVTWFCPPVVCLYIQTKKGEKSSFQSLIQVYMYLASELLQNPIYIATIQWVKTAS